MYAAGSGNASQTGGSSKRRCRCRGDGDRGSRRGDSKDPRRAACGGAPARSRRKVKLFFHPFGVNTDYKLRRRCKKLLCFFFNLFRLFLPWQPFFKCMLCVEIYHGMAFFGEQKRNRQLSILYIIARKKGRGRGGENGRFWAFWFWF